ncbi:related to nonhistone chromosomal protein [Cephalotrichum gorgonifer]|uniref:Related to nonhistone chromosomal protein n=1 Tax=Cephalotrichum gorgonifer TaxID=2041049 RepID=A0AAE8MYB9_9PEZI|nr:related to nonhistone chromosomal protein [Cephalotrichum gorgonifer]
MPRPPKANKDKVPVPAPAPAVLPAQVAPRVVEVENFVRVRDSTLGRLKTIQQLIKSFADDYLRQTNLLLGQPTTAEELSFNEPLAHLEASLAVLGGVPPPQPAAPVEEVKKERKKRTLDPNAPRRPLTAYFLYMQTARPIIAADLGADAPKRAVQEEGQRRWATMGASEKQGWNQAYQYNLRLYNARVHSYKAGNTEAKEMDDNEALNYANEFNIPIPVNDAHDANDQDAIAAQLLQGASAAAPEPEPEVEDTPQAKSSTKKTPAGRKRKTDADETSTPSAAAASPVQKRRRASTKPAEEKEEPKKGRKKGGK